MKKKRIVVSLLVMEMCLSMLGFLCGKPDYVHAAPSNEFYYECKFCYGTNITVEPFPFEEKCGTDCYAIVTCHNPDCVRYDAAVGYGMYSTSDYPTPHHYVQVEHKEPTCTEDGYIRYVCDRNYVTPEGVSGVCNDSKTEMIPAIGHDYHKDANKSKKATCDEDGYDYYVCSNCGDYYQKIVKATDHNYEETVTNPTCTEDGSKVSICSNCGDEISEIIPALGHQYQETRVEPTCTEDGKVNRICDRCGDEANEIIPALGHDYSDDWIIETEPSSTKEGLKYRLCHRCNEREEMIIEKTFPIVPVIVGGVTALAAAVYFALIKPKKIKIKTKGTDGVRTGMLDYEPSAKVIQLCLQDNEDNNAFIEFLKHKKYLDTEIVPYEEIDDLAAQVSDTEPDLVILDVNSNDSLDEIVERINGVKEEVEDVSFSLLISNPNIEEQLNQLVEDEVIENYVYRYMTNNERLVKLILPLYKPDLTSDDSIDFIGQVADVFGIPFVSTITTAYVSGKEIKETIEAGELGVSESATIIADIATIFGMDKVASVAGLVDDIDTIKESRIANENAGVYENSEGFSAAQDIVDVVTDLIDKD